MLFESASRLGVSSMQGGHHVAQKFTSTTWPRCSDKWMGAGLPGPTPRAGKVKSGGYPPTSATLGVRCQRAMPITIPITDAAIAIFIPALLLMLIKFIIIGFALACFIFVR